MFRITRLKAALLITIVVAIILRAVAPSIILNKLNDGLANTSPVYSMHIGDLDLGLLSFSYVFRDIESKYKQSGETFFTMERVRVQISFRELLRLRILTNVVADSGQFVLTKALLEGSKENQDEAKKATKETSKALFPVRIAVVEIHRSAFDVSDFVPQDTKTHWRVSEIEAKAFNINPMADNPYTSFDLTGNLLEKSPFKMIGKAKRLEKPMAWKVDTEVKDLALVHTNGALMHYLPFSFTHGNLDLYSEIASKDGKIYGYVKPFLKDVTVLKSGQHFVSVKHFFFEMAGAFANFMLKNADNKITATKIAFHTEDGHLKVDTGGAIQAALKNGYAKPLAPGIDDSVPFK